MLSSESASSHHSTAPIYDDSRRMALSGVVRVLRLVDPHSEMSIEVTSGDGRVAAWTIEMTARFNLVADGWTDRTVVPGDCVAVTGWPARDDSRRLYARSLLKADGTELLIGTVLRDRAVRGTAASGSLGNDCAALRRAQ
jgi:hypothetical protein